MKRRYWLLFLVMLVMVTICFTFGTAYADQLDSGIYNFRCVDGGRYLNVYAGQDKDGANVCVWDKDGSPEQNFKLVDRGGNKYVLYPQSSSSGRVLDANRGNSYSNPLSNGNNIDIWQTNDNLAQEWYIDDRGGGKYTIELIALRGSVVTCDAPGQNNGNCTLQGYGGGANQQWYLERVDAPAATPTPQPPAPTPEQPVPPTPIEKTAYVNVDVNAGLNLRQSPSTSNSPVLTVLPRGAGVTTIGEPQNGFYQVRYNGTSGWLFAEFLTFQPLPQDVVQAVGGMRTIAPATNNSYFYSNNNIFYASKLSPPFYYGGKQIKGNCTWYAWGRASELLGKSMPRKGFNGNAYQWWNGNKNSGKFKYGSTPKPGAIAVWSSSLPYSGGCGHVAVVEKIEGTKVFISESVWQNTNFKYRELTNRNYLLGYIYINEPNY